MIGQDDCGHVFHDMPWGDANELECKRCGKGWDWDSVNDYIQNLRDRIDELGQELMERNERHEC